LLISREGAVKIVDFGIAKARSISEEEGVVKGKFAYMSPEQARGGRIDHRSDLFATGVILFELLVGRSPYGVPGAEVNADLVARGQLPRARDIVPELPSELDTILARALAHEPADRYQSARDLQLDLTRYLYSRGEIHDAGTLAAFYARIFPEAEPSARGTTGLPSASANASAPAVSDLGVPVSISTPGGSQPGDVGSARMVRKSVVAIHGVLRGFTDLRRSHGEDKVRALMFDYLKVLENIAYRSDAVRERVSEDGFTLLLGLPISTAQDPERAIRLAFDVLDATEGINRNVDPITGSREKGFKISIGVGRVEVRTEATPEGRALRCDLEPGALDAPQALAAAAGPGEVLCGAEIWRAARRSYKFQERSFEDGLRCYWAESALSRAERMRDRQSSVTLYGRDIARKTLRDTFREVLLANQSRSLVVMGETGIGKTALIENFLSELDANEVRILKGACLYYDVDIPFSPLIDLLRDLLQVSEADPLDVIQQKLESELRRYFHPKESGRGQNPMMSGEFMAVDLDAIATSNKEYEYILHSFGPLLGVKYPEGTMEALDAEQRKMRTTLSIQRLFARLARRGATVVLLEDLHWADSLSLEILEAIAKERYPRKILVIMTSQPSERVSTILKSAPTIELEELEPEDRKRLLLDALGDASPRGAEVAAQLSERVGGNPLFLRETAETFAERGAGSGTGPIPTTIWGVVAARLDELKPDEREALRWAAAFGGGVSPQLLESAAGPDIAQLLPHLVERRLLCREESGAYNFRNEITQTVAYEGIPPEDREGVHGRIFYALSARAGAGGAVNPAHLAHHAALAGELHEAVRLYHIAADRARETYSNREALRLYGRALGLLSPDDIERFPIHLYRSRIFAFLGRHSDREAEVAEMLRLAERDGTPLRQARAYVELARVESDLGRRPQAQKALEVALRAARQAHDPATEAEAVRLAAELFTNLGDIPRGLTLARRALEIIGDDPSRRRLRASALKTLGVLQRRSGDVEGAISTYAEAATLAQETHDRALLAQVYNNLGVASEVAGRFEDSLRYYKQGLAIDQEIGNRSKVGIKLGNIGQIYLKLGDFTRALKYLQQAQQIHETMDELGGLADAFTYLARVFLRLGAGRDARAYAERALEIARRDGDRYFTGHALVALAECLLPSPELQDRQRAFEVAHEAAKLGEAAPMPDIHAAGLRLVARASAAAGDINGARAAIQKSLAIIQGQPHADGEEEIYLQHALLMRGADDEAVQSSISRAYQLVQERAARLSDAGRRRSFLESSPNREILSAWQRLRRPE
jgi:predicted ATPase